MAGKKVSRDHLFVNPGRLVKRGFTVFKYYRGSYRGFPVMGDWLILFSVKCEFHKLFFVIRDLKVLRDP